MINKEVWIFWNRYHLEDNQSYFEIRKPEKACIISYGGGLGVFVENIETGKFLNVPLYQLRSVDKFPLAEDVLNDFKNEVGENKIRFLS